MPLPFESLISIIPLLPFLKRIFHTVLGLKIHGLEIVKNLTLLHCLIRFEHIDIGPEYFGIQILCALTDRCTNYPFR